MADNVDIDPDCIKTLNLNEKFFGNTRVLEGDLHNIESSVFSNIIDEYEFENFIVIGGAPCQPFSKAGY